VNQARLAGGHDADRHAAHELLAEIAGPHVDAVLDRVLRPEVVSVRRRWWAELHRRGWSFRRIARATGFDRPSIARAVRAVSDGPPAP